MSQRLGMADGRAFTIYSSNQLFNDRIMTDNGIAYPLNYQYRQLIAKMGPDLLKPITNLQQVGPVPANSINRCFSADVPLLKVPNTN
jgi:pyoverdine/dityrosine biosynthesis protein Dit1